MNSSGRSIFHKLLGGFVGVGVLLTLLFGSIQYWVAKRQIQQEMELAARHTIEESVAYFDKVHAVPLESGLRILEKLSGLDDMLQAWGDKALLIRPTVEKQFLHILSVQQGLFLSIRFFDQQGQERVAVAENKRMREYRKLSNETDSDPYYQQARLLYRQLQEAPTGAIRYLAPFQMPDGRWTLLAGIPKWDPVIGGFTGAILLHSDLTDYLRHVTGLRVAGYHGARLFRNRGAELLPIDGGEPIALPLAGAWFSEEIRLGEDREAVVLRTAFQITPEMVHGVIRQEMLFVFVLMGLMLALVAAFAYLLSRRLSAPIIQLCQGMHSIGEGRFETLPVTTRDEIGDLATAFNRMVLDLRTKTSALERSSDEAALANRAKSLFLANMSHEIRTPMNAVIGLTDLALHTELPPKARDHLIKIAGASHSLLRIINDILDFSKIDAGRLELEQVDFRCAERLDHLAELFRQQVADKRLKLTFVRDEAVPEVVRGDPVRLEQILMNLIGNAIKFSAAGGKVVVTVRRIQEADPGMIRLRISVQDTGIGIAAEHAARLFQPFSQADLSISRTHGGTGLGLAISKRLVELMGGEIWLESTPGVGSIFHFTVRFAPGAEPAGAGPESRPVRGPVLDLATCRECLAGARVLLVEDNLINRQVAQENLELVGMVVEVAGNGLEAIRKVGVSHFDLVLMDVQMPQMDGYAATRILRADPRFRHLPIVAMTAHAMEEDHRASLEAGMNDHLTKPIDRQRLYGALLRWIAPDAVVSGVPVVEEEALPMTEEPEHPQPQPVLDRPMLLDLINNNQVLLRSLLVEFQKQYTTVVEILRSLLAGRRQGDLERARSLVHSLKGSSGNLSAMGLYEAARDLESAIREDRQQAWPDGLDRLQTGLSAVLAAVEEWLEELQAAESIPEPGVIRQDPPQIDWVRATVLMRTLDELLTHQDFSSQGCFEELSCCLAGVAGVDPLADALEQLDFSRGRKALRVLAQQLSVELDGA
ncbi:MAG: response regulator [Magnetococcales bacterium]|nr:response regulator [Magnetococcales bacterium]